MNRIVTLAVLIILSWSAKAQSSDSENNLSDSSHKNQYKREWHHRGNDSLQRAHAFGQGRDEGMNRHNFSRNERERQSFGRHNWAYHVHYTPEQRKQMQAINSDYKKQSTDLLKNDNMTIKEYKAKLLAFQKERKSKLQNLLTQEQKDQLAKWKKQAAENSQVRAAANLERMKIHLQLTDQQASAIQSKQASFREQMKLIYENENLLPYQKMEQMKTLAANQKDAIKSVLTPDQLSTFEDMHRKRFGER